jgi:hypothetical protein
MMTPEVPEHEPVPPECRATAELIQRVLDGEAAPGALEADPHAGACPACRQRVRAASALAALFATPRAPVAVPAGFADRVVKAVQEDRRAEMRRKVASTGAKAAACAAIAAAVVVAAFVLRPPQPRPDVPGKPPEVAKQHEPEVAPAPHAKEAAPAPQPRPIRLGEEFAKAEQRLLEVPNPLAESAAVAPKLFDALGSALKLPDMPNDPMGAALEPARKSLSELPVVAQAGLEPVTGTAEKAFRRFLSDVGSVKPRS